MILDAQLLQWKEPIHFQPNLLLSTSLPGQFAISSEETAAGAKRPEKLQDLCKGDCSGSDRGFRRRTNAENIVITRPMGKGWMKVIAALKSGFL